MQGEKRETSTQNLQQNNVMQQVEGFVSRILPPLLLCITDIRKWFSIKIL